MRNPLKRQSTADPKPSLRERAVALQAIAGRVMRRTKAPSFFEPVKPSEQAAPGAPVGAKPGVAQSDWPADLASGGPSRAEMPAGLDPSKMDKDQHEYAFHGASTQLRLASRDFERLTIAADEVAVREAGGDTSPLAMAQAEAARDAAGARQEQAWRDLFKLRPRTNHQLWLLLRDVARHFDHFQGMTDEPDVFGALIGAADCLRLRDPETRAPHDLTTLTILQLGELADVCRRQARALNDVSGSWCEGPLTKVLDEEHDRIGLLGGMATAEIERRIPADRTERNERLEALIKSDLSGNGYIEPALLAEAVAAWER